MSWPLKGGGAVAPQPLALGPDDQPETALELRERAGRPLAPCLAAKALESRSGRGVR